MATPHPELRQLLSFTLGRVSEEEGRTLADHLSGCTQCQATTEALPADEVVSLIRGVAVGPSPSVRVEELVLLWLRNYLNGVEVPLDQLVAGDPSLGPEVQGRIEVLRRHSQKDDDSNRTQAPNGASTQPQKGPPALTFPVIAGYQVLGLLGTGGMGEVYLAEHLGLKRQVALKVLRQTDAQPNRARFQIEAQAVARLQHPHIIQIHEIGQWQPPGQAEPAPYFALEYLRRGSLKKLLHEGPLPPAEAAHLVEVLARAVQAAHDAGIIHRDLKPDNVLLAEPVPGSSGSLPFGFPKIADFGLARQLDAAERASVEGLVVGTPAYMAPEQAEGQREVGPAADIWALGVILYETLTGQPPFLRKSMVSILIDVCVGTPRPPRQLREEIPEQLEAICLRCLNKDPKRRYPCAAALADALGRFRGSQPGRSAPLGETPPQGPTISEGVPRSRWGRWRLALAGLGLAAVLGIGVLAWRPWQASPSLSGPGPEVLPPLKGQLDVVVYESADPKEFVPAPQRQNLQLYERRALPLRPGDWIRIDAKLNRLAYLYLVWIDTTGDAVPLWPWRSPDPKRAATWTDPHEDALRRVLSLPGAIDPETNLMPLSAGAPGVEALVLLARDTPLSDDEVAELTRLLIPRPRKTARDVAVAVWLENGDRAIDRAPLVTAGQDSGDAEEQVGAVMRRIHERFGYVRGVCFGNQGKDKP